MVTRLQLRSIYTPKSALKLYNFCAPKLHPNPSRLWEEPAASTSRSHLTNQKETAIFPLLLLFFFAMPVYFLIKGHLEPKNHVLRLDEVRGQNFYLLGVTSKSSTSTTCTVCVSQFRTNSQFSSKILFNFNFRAFLPRKSVVCALYYISRTFQLY